MCYILCLSLLVFDICCMIFFFFVLSTVIYRNFMLLLCSFSMVNCRFGCAVLNSCRVQFTSVSFSLCITSYTYRQKHIVFCEGLVCYCVLGTVKIYQLRFRRMGLSLLVLPPICSKHYLIGNNSTTAWHL
jgi:hypothetical protein